jgi:hypothetical protein
MTHLESRDPGMFLVGMSLALYILHRTCEVKGFGVPIEKSNGV